MNKAKRDKQTSRMRSEESKHKHFSYQNFSNEFQSYCYLFLFFKEFQNKIIWKKIIVWDKIKLLKELLNTTGIY